jgi:riboflavin synthase
MMFTGIITHTGRFIAYRRGKLELALEAPGLAAGLSTGDSLSVNGVCLTLIKKEKNTLFFNLSKETLNRSNLGRLRKGGRLNLESSLTLSSPLGGHLVTGHIDSTAKVLNIIKKGTGKRMTISFPKALRPYFIPQGSVALNGVSLTIAALKSSAFEVELIPLTLNNTNLDHLKRGDNVNIECDIIGKYVYNWVSKEKT